MDERIITIFGTSRSKPGDLVYQQAYKIGRLLAQAGFTIANGGYGGTMLAAAKGAGEVGGKVIGVTCSQFSAEPNEYITRRITANSLAGRLDTLIKLGGGYIVLAGGTGTLLEFANVWELKNKGFLKKDKPVILVGEFWRILVELIATDDPDSGKFLQWVAEPEQIEDFFESFVCE